MSNKRLSETKPYEASEHGLEHPPAKEVAKSRESTSSSIGMPVVAIAIAAFGLASIILLTYLNAGVSVIDGSGNSGTSGSVGKLLGSLNAVDGNGMSIENSGVSKSDTVTFSQYYSDSYTTGLRCTFDSFPVYCDGSPVTLSHIPVGKHTLVMGEAGNVGIGSVNYSWVIAS